MDSEPFVRFWKTVQMESMWEQENLVKFLSFRHSHRISICNLTQTQKVHLLYCRRHLVGVTTNQVGDSTLKTEYEQS
jgi:hypothetical protein